MNHEIIIDALEGKIISLCSDLQVYESYEEAMKYLVRLIFTLPLKEDKRLFLINIESANKRGDLSDGAHHELMGYVSEMMRRDDF